MSTRCFEAWSLARQWNGAAVPAAVAAEAEGLDGVLVPDSQNLAPDSLIELAYVAQTTNALRFGTGVTNPVTRHPAVLAGAAATLQARSGGRFVLAIGRGDSSLAHIGRGPAPVKRFERYLTTVRAYLHGDEVPFDDDWVPADVPTIDTLELSIVPETSALRWLDSSTPRVPLDVSASGPRTIAVAAAVADRITFSVGAEIQRVAEAVELARAHAPATISLGVYINIAVHQSIDEARHLVATGGLAAFSRHSMIQGRRGERLDTTAGSLMSRYDMMTHGTSDATHTGALTDDFIDRNAIAGSANQCLARLRSLWDLGIDRFVFVEKHERVGAALEAHAALVDIVIPEMRTWS
jgi:5,10-methylenetetrahydromethanopterin reductase